MPIIGGSLNVPINTVIDQFIVSGAIWYGYPVDGWEVGYRGIVYLKFTNTAAAESSATVSTDPYIVSYPPDPSVTEIILPGQSKVLELDISGLASDLSILKFGMGSEGITLNEVRVMPFAAALFWTGQKNQTESA